MDEEALELLNALNRVAAAFEALGVEYFVGGSVASSIFGEPRQTLDADLVANLLGAHVESLAEHLGSGFYADVAAIRSAVQNQGSFNLIHLDSMTKVDVFVGSRDPFVLSEFRRRQKKSVGESPPLELFFATPEDVVVAKLDWYRKGGEVSDRQWRDILGVLKVQSGRLDDGYIQHWAQELNLTDLLNRARSEAGS